MTASKSYSVGCNQNSDTSATKIIKELLHHNKGYQSEAMKDGLENEQLVIVKYTDLMHQQGHTRVHVGKCGFSVKRKLGLLVCLLYLELTEIFS